MKTRVKKETAIFAIITKSPHKDIITETECHI